MKDINEIVSALIDGTLKESVPIELKRILPHDLPNIAKTIVGIANSGGGYLILGVVDQPKGGGMIVGVDNTDAIQMKGTKKNRCISILLKINNLNCRTSL